MHYAKMLIAVAAITAGSSAMANNPFAHPDKPFHEYSWVNTHNSYEKINQNMQGLPQQMRDGVRSFMLDLYHNSNYREEEQIRICHTASFCYGSFRNQLANEFIPFLKQNRNEVISIFLESYVERSHLQTLFNSVPEVAELTFNPKNFKTDNWPLMSQIVAQNNRLMLFTNKRTLAGDYAVNGKTVTVLFDKDWVAQNHWSTLGAAASNIEAAHNWSCPSRYDDTPVTESRVNANTGKSWSRLFLMNQFHTATKTISDSAAYDNNLTYLTRRVNNCGKTPNFIAIDNYRNGDILAYTKALSQGGIYLWEGNNADPKQDAVCVIPRAQRTLELPTAGCENDEARSLSLSGIAKGTRLSLFDSRSGSREDDHMIIDVTRDIGLHEHVVVGSFEQNWTTDAYKATYVRNNGLNGKVSRIEVTQTPLDFSDASIALYEGNNASQNLDCTIPFDRAYTIKMKSNSYGCSNDEIRSAKILKAKKGAEFSLTGHPEGSFKEGRTVVTVRRDITSPVIISSFNHSYQDADVQVTNHKKGVDGKISFGYISGAK
ncbi:hypothetical protein N5D61_23860 [Pseudomonas sp. GD03842]|uniref:hypothetical protein n=1 Tax=Pseudomonas sp. GD03842 TaxID=2975385 RepID=UPI00244B39F2|nr:hypothetical protein [Pseudomonas sp. GD03842]MDH0749366.1 hypothetical protein [Pseudomonas sp. GD03842]